MEDDSSPRVGAERPARAAMETSLVDAICAGDEDAWAELVRGYGPSMLRVARLYVSSRTVAEEVVQEAWLAALTAIERFERRSSLKTWLFRILTNQAQTRGAKEGRSVPFSALTDAELGEAGPSVELDRFRATHERWADHWRSTPQRWSELPEERLLARETIALVERAAAALPPAQRAVLTLRDILGWDANEVCEVLGITAANQRVLLHRARTKIRRTLERTFAS